MSMDYSVDNCFWYAIHTNPRQEMRAESNLQAWGVETYLPKIREGRLNHYNSSRKWLTKPLFLRYLFARFRFSVLGHKIRYTRGVQDVVGFGDLPVPINDEVIKLIQSRHDELGYVKLEDEIRPGDEIVIKDGVFKDIHGIFERSINGSDRVMILLKAIQFQAHIIIDRISMGKT